MTNLALRVSDEQRAELARLAEVADTISHEWYDVLFLRKYGDSINADDMPFIEACSPTKIAALLADLAAAEAECQRLRKRAAEQYEKLDRDYDKTLTEREDAEDALYMACKAIFEQVAADDCCKACPVENCEPETCEDPVAMARDWYLSEAAGERIKRERDQAAPASAGTEGGE